MIIGLNFQGRGGAKTQTKLYQVINCNFIELSGLWQLFQKWHFSRFIGQNYSLMYCQEYTRSSLFWEYNFLLNKACFSLVLCHINSIFHVVVCYNKFKGLTHCLHNYFKDKTKNLHFKHKKCTKIRCFFLIFDNISLFTVMILQLFWEGVFCTLACCFSVLMTLIYSVSNSLSHLLDEICSMSI